VFGDLFIEQAQGMRKLLAGQHLQLAVAIAAAQIGGGLPAAVGDQHRGIAERRGEAGGGGMCDVVRYEVHGRWIQPG
jgi:hypothetical protein